MNGYNAFYPMIQKIGEDQDNDYIIKDEDVDGLLYKNENDFDNEDEYLSEEDHSIEINQNLNNENAEENNEEIQNHPNEVHQKECVQNIVKTEHFETTTKFTTLFKTKLTLSDEEIEIYAKINELNEKRSKTNDKGKRTNQITNRIKENSLYDSQIVVIKMIKKTEYYKYTKKNLNKIDSSSYKFENSSKNLLFIQKTFKDFLSEKKENEQIIRIIMNYSNYPSLIKFLNMTIENIISLYSDECNSSEHEGEEYFLQLQKSYKKLKDKLKQEGKSDIYIESFNYFAGHIKYVFNSINDHKIKSQISK